MQSNDFRQARKLFFALVLLATGFLTGCDLTITNLTPGAVQQNPSNIYTVQARIAPRAANIVEQSVRPRIIIDGQSYPMRRSPVGANIFEFDYHLPAGRTEARYYFIVDYQFQANGVISHREDFTQPFDLRLIDRYVLSLEVNRAPVGAKVSVLGRGFASGDTIYLDGTPARTLFESPNAISFYVPDVDPSRNYQVSLAGPNGESEVGTFRVDPVTIQVVPQSVALRSGERQMLVFSMADPAPAGGLLIDLKTDIPDSVIMPEVMIPAGSRSVSIPVQGAAAGNGSLFLRTANQELVVPVTVSAR